MTRPSILRRYAGAAQNFVAARGLELLVLQASPLLGALLGSANHEGISPGRIASLLAGSLALTAHVYVFNDWAGRSDDLNDARRARYLFGRSGVSSRQVASVAVGLLIVAILLLAFVGASPVLFGAAMAAVSLLYSGPTSWGKGRPIIGTLLHLIGAALHFLLGYTGPGHAIDVRGISIALFFGLVFAGGHLNQEVRDYEADRRNRIRTNAVVFGCRRAFLSSLLVFTAAYLLVAVLAWFGILARPLIWTVMLWPWHVACSMQALRSGLGFETAVWMQRRFRLQLALLGLAMVLTAPPVTHLARRVHQHAHDGTLVRHSA